MIKRLFQQDPSMAAVPTDRADSRPAQGPFSVDAAPTDLAAEVAVEDLNDLFAAALSRLSDWLVKPPADPGVMLACLQALRQLHQTAANELLRRQHLLDGRR